MTEPTNNQDEEPRSLIQHIKDNKLDIVLYVSRIFTILFTIGYVIPIFGNAQRCYYRVLLANGFTSALRLSQRLPNVQLSKEFLGKLLNEDSCHYLFYSLIFMYVSPILYIILPVLLFAVLHSASYSLTIIDIIGQNAWWGARFLISIVEFQTRNILRLAAFTEIVLMPLCIIFVFIGRAGFMTPLVYYHFISLRYASKRNPHTKILFTEIRKAIETVARNPRYPTFLRNALISAISLVSRLAPQQHPVAPQPQTEQSSTR